MTVEIRRLGPADVEAYREVRLRSVKEHPEAFGASFEEESARTVEMDRERLAAADGCDDNVIFAAFDGDRPVGLAGILRLMPHRARLRHRALVWGVYVAPEARGHGVGRRLMDTALAAIRKADGISVVQLGVGAENPEARALYASVGFETYGLEKRSMILDGRYIDEELMALLLDD